MEIRQIPLNLVTPSPMNPRKTFDEENIVELADNIHHQGLLQPITVRPIHEGNPLFNPEHFEQGYEIICGERRFRACRYNDYERNDGVVSNISAIVREMTDKEAFDAMITENLQRKDVDPIEEAFAFGMLIKNGDTVEEVALRFGKSIRFVQDRCKLNNLIPELMKEVREGRCPIVTAMMIAKLDDETQKRFFTQHSNTYQGFSKQTAERFIDNLFMSVDKSLWCQSKETSDKDFEGGCNRKCVDCPLNTSNHGCLFYEMKSEDSGRCTSRKDFNSKTLAFLEKQIDRHYDILVKKGEPMEYGKAVIGVPMKTYDGDESAALKQKILDMLNAKNIKVVDPERTFVCRNFYNLEDERTLKMLKDGDVYRVIQLFSYNAPAFSESTWHIKKSNDDVDAAGASVEVVGLLDDLKKTETALGSSITVECVKAMSKASSAKGASAEPLADIEKKLLMLLIIRSNYDLRRRLGLGQFGPIDADYKAVKDNFNLDLFLRSWMQNALHCGDNSAMRSAEPILDEIGALWHPDEYKKTKDAVLAKFEKKKAKIENKLAELGYAADGTPLVAKEQSASALQSEAR